MTALRCSRIPYFSGVQDIAIERLAEDRLKLTCRTGGKQRAFEAGHIGLHEGVIPEQHIARSAGCAYRWDDVTLSFTPVRDRELESSVPGIFIAGDAGGTGGAMAAVAEGEIAAIAILRRLEKISPTAASRGYKQAERERAAHLAPRPLLDRLYRPTPSVAAPADDAVICRCEEIGCREIRAAIAAGCDGPNQLKAFLRTGMGPCQGRLCGTTISMLIAAQRKVSPDEAGFYTVRSPLSPVTVGELADLSEDSELPPDSTT
ncbi:(2Fe-2S)-binding protein [Acerihabitans sp. KWT182]|uniref:(2Fe-2S)-binding protein n=1 Tax=Acerihabitans sp. KWT182 TaxID=3157919 RepID=A0AAU7Q437_9GAMM